MAIKYEKIGRGIEDMPTATNYETNSVKDVTGVTETEATVGIATTEASPVTVRSDSKFAKVIDTAVEREHELSKLEHEFLCVKDYKRVGTDFESGKPIAWKQKAVVVPGDFATGNQSLQMSATLNWVGTKTFGIVDFSAVDDKFTKETSEPSETEVHYKEGKASRSDYQIFFMYDDTPVI